MTAHRAERRLLRCSRDGVERLRDADELGVHARLRARLALGHVEGPRDEAVRRVGPDAAEAAAGDVAFALEAVGRDQRARGVVDEDVVVEAVELLIADDHVADDRAGAAERVVERMVEVRRHRPEAVCPRHASVAADAACDDVSPAAISAPSDAMPAAKRGLTAICIASSRMSRWAAPPRSVSRHSLEADYARREERVFAG